MFTHPKEELKIISPNPEIEAIIDDATNIAKSQTHEYVTLEHILLSMVRSKNFGTALSNFGVDIVGLVTDITVYLSSSTELISKDPHYTTPRKTHSLERVFNRALTQVMFSGRSHIQVIDVFISIASESSSYAAYFIAKYGLDKAFGVFSDAVKQALDSAEIPYQLGTNDQLGFRQIFCADPDGHTIEFISRG